AGRRRKVGHVHHSLTGSRFYRCCVREPLFPVLFCACGGRNARLWHASLPARHFRLGCADLKHRASQPSPQVPLSQRAPRAAKEKPASKPAAKPEQREQQTAQAAPRWKPMGLAPADTTSISPTQGQPKRLDAGGYSCKIWSALARKKPNAGERGSTTVTFAVGPAGALRFVR